MNSQYHIRIKPEIQLMRTQFLDQLRTILMLLVILHHSMVTYAKNTCCWFIQQNSIGPPISDLLGLVVSFNQSFFMGMFFLISGYFVPISVEKKGSLKFMKDRMRRLGIPLLVTWFILSPLIIAISESSRGERIGDTFAKFFSLDGFYLISGPMWFVITLMVFNVAYLIWKKCSNYHFIRNSQRQLPGTSHLAAVAIGAAISSLIVAYFAPLGVPISGSKFLLRIGLDYWIGNLSFLPAYIILFAIGCVSAEGCWLERVPADKAKTWGLIGLVAATIWVVCYASRMVDKTGDSSTFLELYGKTIYLIISPFVAWGVISWLLWWFRTHVIPFGKQIADSGNDSYGAYILHPIILVSLTYLFTLTKLPAVISLTLLIIAGSILSFMLAHFLRALPISRGIL